MILMSMSDDFIWVGNITKLDYGHHEITQTVRNLRLVFLVVSDLVYDGRKKTFRVGNIIKQDDGLHKITLTRVSFHG